MTVFLILSFIISSDIKNSTVSYDSWNFAKHVALQNFDDKAIPIENFNDF